MKKGDACNGCHRGGILEASRTTLTEEDMTLNLGLVLQLVIRRVRVADYQRWSFWLAAACLLPQLHYRLALVAPSACLLVHSMTTFNRHRTRTPRGDDETLIPGLSGLYLATSGFLHGPVIHLTTMVAAV